MIYLICADKNSKEQFIKKLQMCMKNYDYKDEQKDVKGKVSFLFLLHLGYLLTQLMPKLTNISSLSLNSDFLFPTDRAPERHPITPANAH